MTTKSHDQLLAEASILFQAALGRPIEPAAKSSLEKRIANGQYDRFTLLIELIGSSEFMTQVLARKVEAHLGLIHRARQIMVRRLLPQADDIIDLGGINSPLLDMGYRHSFNRMVMVDLAAGDRHAMYRDASFNPQANTGVTAHVGDMTRLDAFPSESFDLAWSGQSIEHVDIEAGARMCVEAYRVLKPGGFFCLDTPNRGVTSIHTRDIGGGFIHPEHKHEYHVPELRNLLIKTGFDIVAEHGICEMQMTLASGNFHYEDFVLGNAIVDDPEMAYIMYFSARKPSRCTS